MPDPIDESRPDRTSGPHRARARALAACAGALAACAALLAPATPAGAAIPLEPEASFGSALAPDGRFASPAGVATDDAGRVYVADAGAGRIEVYDRAADGNAFLRTVGEEVLDCPVGVRIDNRGRIYAADACRDVVVMFDSFVDGAPVRREFGGSGTELGRMAAPRYLAVDDAARVFVAERSNARVQVWRPSGGRQVPVSAFGIAEPPGFVEPEGLARSGDGSYLLSGGPAGQVRLYDERGMLVRVAARTGSAPGEVADPRGLARDRLGRVLLADAGNRRLQVLAPIDAGLAPLAETAPGVLDRPQDASLAPGALLYVTDAGTGRVVRLRYDDADGDGAIDGRDVCRGFADPVQLDTDRDGQGDGCDADDDGDGVVDDDDRCPVTRRGVDANGDGCGDPRSRISAPRDRKTFDRRRPPTRIAGSAAGDELGVERVEIALGLVRGSRCRWYDGRALRAPAPCDQPLWVPATGAARWVARVRLRQRGSYRLMSRAVQSGGLAETVFNRRNLRVFRIR